MRSKTLWKRFTAVALSAVLAVPVMSAMPVKEAEAKTIYQAILEEDFQGETCDERIQVHGSGEVAVEDGMLKAFGSSSNGTRAVGVEVEAGRTYRISYKVKVDASSVYSFAQAWEEEFSEEENKWVDVSGSYSAPKYFTNTNKYAGTGWHDIVVEYTVPEGANRLQYVIYNNEAAKDYVFYIDDFTVEVVTEVPSLVANGTFGTDAADTTGWDVEVSTQQQKMGNTYLYQNDFSAGEVLSVTTSGGTAATIADDGDNKVMKMTNTPTANRAVTTANGIKVEPGKTYSISYRAKRETAAAGNLLMMLIVQSWNASGSNYKSSEVSVKDNFGDWVVVATEYTVPEGNTNLQVMIEERWVENVVYYVDDVVVSIEEAQTEIVYTSAYDCLGFDATDVGYGNNWSGSNIVAGEGVDGSNAQKMERLEGATGNALLYFTSATAILEAGTEYTVSFDARSTGTATWRCYVDNIGSGATNWQILGDYTGTTDWATYSYTVTPAETKTWPQLGFQIVGGAGCLYIDNFTVSIAENVPVMEYTDGVCEGGKEGYGLKVTDKTVAMEVTEGTAISYEYNLWVKVEEGAKATFLANGTQTVATEGPTNGEWVNLTGEFSVADGLQTFGIQAEGAVYVDEIEIYPHVHVITRVAAKEANCTEKGVTEHYICSLCDTHFADAEGNEIITEEDYVVAASHTIESVEKEEESCKKAGVAAHYICSVCSTHFADEEGTEIITEDDYIIPAAEHTGEVIPGKAATCTEAGLTEGEKCSVCGDPIAQQQVIPAKGHTYDKGKVTKEATCKATGVMTYTCTSCPATKTSVIAKVAMPGKSAITKTTGAKKKITIKFKKVSGINGYEIQVATKKNMKKGLKTYKVSASKAKHVAKKLKAKTKYWVRIRTYKIAGGETTYSGWSSKKAVKTK